MSQRAVEGSGEASTKLGAETIAAIVRGVGTRPRRWLLAVTLLLGLVTAAALTVELSPIGRTFAAFSGPVQLLMSVTLPFIGVLLVSDLRQTPRTARLTPTLLAAVLLAAAVGAFGVLVCATTIAVAGSSTAGDTWADAATIAVGGVLIQIVAQLVGTGLGLLLRPPIVAFLATIVLPLGLWFLLGTLDILRPARAWLTPYATAQNLLSGHMRAVEWAQWFVVLLLWGVGLHTVGAARLMRQRRESGPGSDR